MAGAPIKADWIAVDWGTSQLRAWAMSGSGRVLDQARSDQGMAGLARADFEPALIDLVAPWLGSVPTPVVACGMVGAQQGWVEAGYQTAPCPPLSGALTPAPAQDRRIRVQVIPGISQTNPADVMRGEETQIAGFLAGNPSYDGVLCLPGTHSKWVLISAGEVVHFQTFMTGELFALLAERSVLRHSVQSDGWDSDAFSAALAEQLSKPEGLAARLFSLRAEALLQGLPAPAAKARLSGYLIGAELAASRAYWLGRRVALIGETALAQLYATALTAQGATPTLENAETMTIAGLSAAQSKLQETQT